MPVSLQRAFKSAFILLLGGGVIGLPQEARSATMVGRLASEEIAKLDAHDDTTSSREMLIMRNLSRYFALYSTPSNPKDMKRFVGTAKRMMRRTATELYREMELLAREQGSPAIEPAHVEEVLDRVFPSTPAEFNEILVFPKAPTEEQVRIETIDLEASRDTGLCWEALEHLSEVELDLDSDRLPMEESAVKLFAEGLNIYALLLFRIGGDLAREDHANHLKSHFLRRAGKTITERASSEGVSQQAKASNPTPGTIFTDVTEDSGISFRHVSSDWIGRFRRYGQLAPTFSGGGVTAGDVDGDNWPDLIICGGQGCFVYRNRRDGTFEDKTASSGLNVPGEARMAVVADLDNDGLKDVFITYARDTNRLFHNLGGGRFRDVTAESGLEREGDISGPAVAADIDNDGLLDIYVGNFGDYLAGEDPWQPSGADNALPNRLYQNLGGLKFKDISVEAGVDNTGWAQALSHLDLDLDGYQDFYIANDFGHNEMLLNNGDGTFRSAGAVTGSDDPFHGMNVAFADLNLDTFADIFVTNIWGQNPVSQRIGETNTLLLSAISDSGEVVYERVEDEEFRSQDTGWAWAGLFFDYDNDGDADLFVANGFTSYYTFTQPRLHPTMPGEIYHFNQGEEPNRLFRNDTGLPTTLIADSGSELSGINSRGVALLDYDRDGDLDMAVSTFHSWARLLRNDGAPAKNNWLVVELEGDPAQGSNRDAIGTQLLAWGPDDLYIWRAVTGGEGYLSQGTSEVELGLGLAKSVDLEIFWPGMRRQEFLNVKTNQRIRIRQGASEVEVLPAAPSVSP